MELTEHPQWNELELLCNKIVSLKEKSKALREKINKDCFGKEKQCPYCKYEGQMNDTDGYILECPECEERYNEDD